MTEDEIKQIFIERTKKHIAAVNKYAGKLGLQYPNHDASKLDELLDGYCYFMVPKEERTPEQEEALDIVTLIHIKNAPHHPEYWTDTSLKGWTRDNNIPNGPIDATDMPKENLVEMVCDWCAVSEEKGNTPIEWFNKVNGVRWVFSQEQQNYIRTIIRELWK